ncbi:hypothetical protein IAT40_006346 [Kwoniella sp. CBS 6097]
MTTVRPADIEALANNISDLRHAIVTVRSYASKQSFLFPNVQTLLIGGQRTATLTAAEPYSKNTSMAASTNTNTGHSGYEYEYTDTQHAQPGSRRPIFDLLEITCRPYRMVFRGPASELNLSYIVNRFDGSVKHVELVVVDGMYDTLPNPHKVSLTLILISGHTRIDSSLSSNDQSEDGLSRDEDGQCCKMYSTTSAGYEGSTHQYQRKELEEIVGAEVDKVNRWAKSIFDAGTFATPPGEQQRFDRASSLRRDQPEQPMMMRLWTIKGPPAVVDALRLRLKQLYEAIQGEAGYTGSTVNGAAVDGESDRDEQGRAYDWSHVTEEERAEYQVKAEEFLDKLVFVPTGDN